MKTPLPASDLFAVDGPWSEMAKVLGYPQAKTVKEVIDHARWLVESYHAMCSRLQEQVQKHKLGLGGEKIDILVCEALDSEVTDEEWAEIEKIRANLPPPPPGVGGFEKCQQLTAADLSITINARA